MKTKLILIRHGESLWNKEKIYWFNGYTFICSWNSTSRDAAE